MIVTSGEESIQAIRYTPETRINVDSPYLNPIVAGQIETLYRKTNTTNFVYGTTIKTDDTFRLGCRSPICGQYRALKPHELYKEKYFDAADVRFVLCNFAARLEAAHNRELKTKFGNNAAIRNALKIADETACKLLKWISNHYQELNCMGDRLRRALESAAKESWRNCDRFGGDYKMLHTAWFDWTGSPSGQNADGTAKMAFGEWLLAPAIKKGGAK